MPKLRGQATGIALAILAALALALNARLTVLNVRGMTEASALVSQTHRVVEKVQALQSSLQDAETGQRGFLITGEPRYLEPYESGVQGTDQLLDDLGEMTRDNPEQQETVESIRPLALAKLDELERTVRLRQREPGGFDAARAIVLTDEGRRLMDALRAKVSDVIEQEKELLDERARASAAAARTATTTAVGGFGANLFLLAAAAVTLRRRAVEREHAAAQLHEEKERFRTTLSSIGDAVIVTDVKGEITMLNPTARSLLGWDDAALGRPLDEVFNIVNEDTRQPVESPVSKVLRDGQIAGLANHTVLIRPDGSVLPIDDSGAPVRDAHGEMVGVVLVFRDIGERRETERELHRRADLLKDQDRRKDEFLVILSHELRNPLAPIRNAIALLQRVEPASEHALRAREVIDRQVTQLTRLVDDLLDISRITEGKIRLNPERLCLTDTIRRTVEDHRGPFERKGVTLALENSGEPVWVDADPTRLVQVVGNILENAAKFTNAGGHVSVSLARNGDRALLRIRDDGAGMDQATLGRIFQPFVQADSTLARTQGGLGLGLALVKNLVELHGGSVEASSEGVGRGTEFLVALPAAQA